MPAAFLTRRLSLWVVLAIVPKIMKHYSYDSFGCQQRLYQPSRREGPAYIHFIFHTIVSSFLGNSRAEPPHISWTTSSPEKPLQLIYLLIFNRPLRETVVICMNVTQLKKCEGNECLAVPYAPTIKYAASWPYPCVRWFSCSQ